jgi:hypothetical protein
MCSMALKRTIGETCIICEQPKEKGIHLYTSFICEDCEKDMVITDTSDPKYKYYIERLRNIPSKQNIS